jgi:hypothetical protein
VEPEAPSWRGFDERLPPWKRGETPNAPAAPAAAPSVSDADLLAHLQKMKEKKKKKEKRSRRKRRKKSRRAAPPPLPLPAKPAERKGSRKYKVFIPVTAPDGSRRPPSRPTPVAKPPPLPRDPKPERGTRLCPKCRWVLKAGQRYCNFCGAPITPAGGTPASSAPSSRPRYEPRYAQKPVTTFTRSVSRPRRRGSGCTVPAVGILVVGIFIVGAVFFSIISRAEKLTRHRKYVAEAKESAAKARALKRRLAEKAKRATATSRPSPRRKKPSAPSSRITPFKGSIVLNRRVELTTTWKEKFVGTVVNSESGYFTIRTRNRNEFKVPRSLIVSVRYLKEK